MSVQSEIERLESAKSNLKAAIEEKGVTVPEGTKLDGYGALVGQIESGDGPWTKLEASTLPNTPSGGVAPNSDVSVYAPEPGDWRYLALEIHSGKNAIAITLASAISEYTYLCFVDTNEGKLYGPNLGPIAYVHGKASGIITLALNSSNVGVVNYRFESWPV